MASYSTAIQRSSSSTTAQTSEPMLSHNDEPRISSEPVSQNGFKIYWPFNIPSTEEAALVRITRNLKSFVLFYALFVYFVLFITLIPKRKVSLILLIIMKEITYLYVLLLRSLPNSVFLHKIIDKRVVFFLLSIITGLELVLTHASVHLFITLASTMPVVFVHSLLWKSEDALINQDYSADGESLLPVVQNEP